MFHGVSTHQWSALKCKRVIHLANQSNLSVSFFHFFSESSSFFRACISWKCYQHHLYTYMKNLYKINRIWALICWCSFVRNHRTFAPFATISLACWLQLLASWSNVVVNQKMVCKWSVNRKKTWHIPFTSDGGHLNLREIYILVVQHNSIRYVFHYAHIETHTDFDGNTVKTEYIYQSNSVKISRIYGVILHFGVEFFYPHWHWHRSLTTSARNISWALAWAKVRILSLSLLRIVVSMCL